MSGSNLRRESGVSDSQRAAVVAHYERRLEEHGATAEGMDWKDAASQTLRFEVLCGLCDLNGMSLHEIGAGAGHLVDYLAAAGITTRYSGSDRSPAMVEAARRAHPGVRFDSRDALSFAPDESFDVIVCSGLFHVKLDAESAAWQAFVEATIRQMFEHCRVGIAFNLMSNRVDFRADALYYSNPAELLDFCLRELSTNVTLRHDYPLYEYTAYVYRS